MIKVAIAYPYGCELKIDIEEYASLEAFKEVFDIDQIQEKDFLNKKTIDVSEFGEQTSVRLIN